MSPKKSAQNLSRPVSGGGRKVGTLRNGSVRFWRAPRLRRIVDELAGSAYSRSTYYAADRGGFRSDRGHGESSSGFAASY